MLLCDPTVKSPEQNNERAMAIQSIKGGKIGILHNGKLNASNMLLATAAYFEKNHGFTIGPIYSKNNAGAPAPHETLALAAKNSDFLITGLGD